MQLKLLVASVAQQIDEIYLPHLQTLLWQDVNAELSFLVINDGLSENALDELEEMRAQIWASNPKPNGALYRHTDQDHEWNVPTYHWLAFEKQRILDYARTQDIDALIFVDSDLLFAPDTFRLLMETGKPIVSPVFWTRWRTDWVEPWGIMPPLPQVWKVHPNKLGETPEESFEFLRRLENGELTEVVGLGGATLIRREVLGRVGFWPLLTDLGDGVWQGEDRHFCIRATRNGIELWADPRPRVHHCYRRSESWMIPEIMHELRKGSDVRLAG